MPENETLVYDVRMANRWQRIGRRIDRGLAPTEAFPTIQEEFYTSLQKVWKQWSACGVDPADLLKAALNDRHRFDEPVRKTNSDRNARLLGDVAAGLEERNMEGLVREFVVAAWKSVQGQLQLDRQVDELPPGFIREVEDMLNRISKGLLRNPSRFPSRVRRQRPADISAQLSESLLGGNQP